MANSKEGDDFGKQLRGAYASGIATEGAAVWDDGCGCWTETTAFDYVEFQRQGGNNTDWYGTAQVYEWKDEYGDVGPAIPRLDVALFGGSNADWCDTAQATSRQPSPPKVPAAQGPENLKRIKSFEDAGLHPVVLENIKIKAEPLVVIVVPMHDNHDPRQHKVKTEPLVVIAVPTRHLAI
ncbi:hypothetical protein KC315_g2419 [Hortaea werneckii]|nr:hypothetical protein KC315_g2419 [Hortaea werneckii]